MQTIVALDIETTGLRPEKDEIIEIGGVRFSGSRVEAEWSTLIKPRRGIPREITQLTGITNHMVSRAPVFADIAHELQDFVGDAPILGHNVQFDLSFLNRRGVLLENDSLDTFDLASVLLPRADRYNLSALGHMLRIPLPATHRALDDARVTHAVFHNLYQKALGLPINLLAEIVRLGEPHAWGGAWIFEHALRERSREPIAAAKTSKTEEFLFGGPEMPSANPISPSGEFGSLDPEEVASILEYGGSFSKYFDAFEYRPEQVEMLKAITDALSHNQHLMVEAGTGTGKSIAYLIPAALWAVQNNTRVVVSTNTINLQEQLVHKDIPDVCAALDINLRATVLKGRSNYLCPRRLATIRRTGPESAAEMRVLAKVLVWLNEGAGGDRGEINLTGPSERAIWSRISAADEGCTSDTCLRRMGATCPFYRAHKSAETAHLIVVNHALLLADVATGNRVLPEYQYLIVDEAHHLESATTNALSYRITQGETERMLRELGGANAGILGRTLRIARDYLEPEQVGFADHLVHNATDRAFQFQNTLQKFFITISGFLEEQRDGRTVGPYGHKERILPATRTQPAWTEVEMVWDDAQNNLRSLLETLAELGKGLAELVESQVEPAEDTYGSLATLYRRLNELYENLEGLVFNPTPDLIYWAEVFPNGDRLSLQAAPLHIGLLMQEHLWHQKESVILTSATLTTAGEFEYLRNRLYAEDADELALGSPFDYESAALVYIPTDIPEPGDRAAYQRALNQGLINLCRETGGRTLVLFTSYNQLQQTARTISSALAEQDIHVYVQGAGPSPHALLNSFRGAEQAVLLGTRSFWEGVDVPGEDLSVLAITKLPFDVPSDPIVAARAETFEDPFYQYTLPEAILRFRQGFGRLIRTQTDRGVVAILDRRIISKMYGRAFLDSLPQSTMVSGPVHELPRKAAQWLGF